MKVKTNVKAGTPSSGNRCPQSQSAIVTAASFSTQTQQC